MCHTRVQIAVIYLVAGTENAVSVCIYFGQDGILGGKIAANLVFVGVVLHSNHVCLNAAVFQYQLLYAVFTAHSGQQLELHERDCLLCFE